MADQLDFAAALARRPRARASMAARRCAATAIAGAAVAARPARRLALPWTLRGMAWGWVAVMVATLAIVGGTLLAGALLRDWYQGPWLAYTSMDGLYLAHEDGTHPRRILASGNRLWLSGWSGDGTLVAVIEEVASDNGSVSRTLVVDRDGRIIRSIDGAMEAGWSHHGHRIAWMSTGDALMVTDIETGATSTWLASGPDTIGSHPDWSPDDTRIALTWYEGTGSGSLRIVAHDGSVRDLYQDPDSWWEAPRWSPDGRLLSVVTRSDSCGNADDGTCPSDILIIDAATGSQVDAIRDLNWAMGRAWSPDGTRLAWDEIDRGGKQENLFVGALPLSGGTPVQVTDWPGAAWVVSWTDDGTSLLAAHVVWSEDGTEPEPNELWRVPVDPAKGDPVLLRDDVFGAALQPTP